MGWQEQDRGAEEIRIQDQKYAHMHLDLHALHVILFPHSCDSQLLYLWSLSVNIF